jgi:hypothetical protein
MKIRPVGAELFHADRRADEHEANSCISQFCEIVYKSVTVQGVDGKIISVYSADL